MSGKAYRPSMEQDLQMDAMDAYRIFQNARSLFFWLILLGLIGMQIIFWVVDRGMIDATIDQDLHQKPAEIIRYDMNGQNRAALQFVADENAQAPAATDDDQDTSKTPRVYRPDDGSDLFKQPDLIPAVPDNHRPATPQDVEKSLRNLLEICTVICQYMLIFLTISYPLILLTGLHISIIGRLGGMTEGTKSFLVSLFVMVLLLPWQRALCGEASGALFNFSELIAGYVERCQSSSFTSLIQYYGRFVGLWLLTVLLLISSYWSSRAAAQMIQLRLHFGRHHDEDATETPHPRNDNNANKPPKEDNTPIKLED